MLIRYLMKVRLWTDAFGYVNQADLNERQAQPEARCVKPGERDWETL